MNIKLSMEDKLEPSSSSVSDTKKRKRFTNSISNSQLDNGDSLNQNDHDNHEYLSLEKSLSFSDTLIALRMMHAQFPKLEKVSVKPFVLRSQLYSSVKDRTQVDRELELLKRENVLRVFKLNTGQDDHAIMFLEDYIQQHKSISFEEFCNHVIRCGRLNYFFQCLDGLRERGLSRDPIGKIQSELENLSKWFLVIDVISKKIGTKKEADFAVFGWFKSHVILSKLEPGIAHQELCFLLASGGKVKDEHISLLVNAGVITRQLIDPNMYWFAVPNIGSILKGISQGRKELLSFLNRRKFKEMMLASLEKKRLQFSPLDMRFHLRDLIGSGHLQTFQTPTGVVVRVLKD